MSSPAAIGSRLSVMMFLQFFIWGSWYVTVGNYIGAVGWDEDAAGSAIGWAYTVGPIAAIVSPLFLGVLADRFMPTQVVLACMHFLGAAFMCFTPIVATPEQSPNLLIAMLAGHMLCYMPTLGLTNTLAFHHVTNQEKQFPIIRVFGTLGWIAAGLLLGNLLGAKESSEQFYVAGAAGAALGVFALTLPHTPPPLRGKSIKLGEIFGLDAIALLRDRSFLVFMLASFLICVPLAAYYQQAPIFLENGIGYAKADVPVQMSFGQMAEVLFMVAMPWFFARLGVKKMIAVGMLAWVVRYVLFAQAADEQVKWMVLSGIVLHGICYDFFFVTGQIYVDKFAKPEIRGQAQGFLVLITQGVGLGIGAQVVSELKASATEGDVTDWAAFWWWPAIAAGVILVAFLLLFRERAEPERDAP